MSRTFLLAELAGHEAVVGDTYSPPTGCSSERVSEKLQLAKHGEDYDWLLADTQNESLFHGTTERLNALSPSRCLTRIALVRCLRSSHAARRKANPDAGHR